MYLYNRNRFTEVESRLMVAKGEGDEGGKDWESGISKLAYIYIYKMDKLQGPTL